MKRLIAVFCCLILLVSLFACAAESYENGAGAFDSKSAESQIGWSAEESSAESKTDGADPSDLGSRKQIFYYDLSLQTTGFDALTDKIRTEAQSAGGFVESMDQSQYGSLRYLTVVVRIPAARAEAYTEGIAGDAVVTARSQESEDVTLEYVDVETRIKNLESERQALNAMMEKAQTVEDLISIQTRLSDVQYELESYTARRNKLDELVGLSQVTFHITEVARESELDKADQSVWSEIAAGFANNLHGVGEFFRALFVGFVSALPILIFPAAIILVIVFSVRHAVRKNKKKNAFPQQTPPAPPQQNQTHT